MTTSVTIMLVVVGVIVAALMTLNFIFQWTYDVKIWKRVFRSWRRAWGEAGRRR